MANQQEGKQILNFGETIKKIIFASWYVFNLGGTFGFDGGGAGGGFSLEGLVINPGPTPWGLESAPYEGS